MNPIAFLFLHLFRLTGFFAATPFFASNSIGLMPKIMLYCCVTSISYLAAVNHLGYDLSLHHDWSMMVDQVTPLILMPAFLEFLLGFTIGMIFRIAITAMLISLEFISMAMGLQASTMLDPMSDIKSNTLGQLGVVFFNILFITVGGIEYMLDAYIRSYQTMELGRVNILNFQWIDAFNVVASTLETGVKLSFPIIALLLCINLFMAIMSRIAPQIQVFIFGFTLTIMGGFLILYYYFNDMMTAFLQEFDRSITIVNLFIGS